MKTNVEVLVRSINVFSTPAYNIRRALLYINKSCTACTDKKENKIFLIYKEIQKGSVAKSYMTNSLLIYG
jgi:hypothetical protein